MKLKINNKIFLGRYNKKQELFISLDNDLDIHFFKKWENKEKIIKVKKDHVKDIQVFKENEIGILINCFPVLIKENKVKIIYDHYQPKFYKKSGKYYKS